MENQHAQVSEIQLSSSLRIKPSLLPKISHSRDAYQILKNSWDFNKIELVEQFKVMLLNSSLASEFHLNIEVFDPEAQRFAIPAPTTEPIQ